MLAALGLRWGDAFSHARRASAAREIVATYDYATLSGELIAQKLRYSNKTFRWRRPGKQPDTWIWNLKGTAPGLYRLAELLEVPQVFLGEGEKSVDLLSSLGIAATCGPSGASAWLPDWSRDLADVGCRELVILPDADVPGDRHAERVAEITVAEIGAAMAVKILPLPGLQRGADVFDWLRGEKGISDLLARAQEAPVWFPGAKEHARRERRRAQNAERQRRFRARHRMEVVRNAANERSAVA